MGVIQGAASRVARRSFSAAVALWRRPWGRRSLAPMRAAPPSTLRAPWPIAAVGAWLLCAAVAAAQEPSGPESPELQSLRLFEEELFGPPPSPAESEGVRVSPGPAAVRSDGTAPARPEVAPVSRELSWLGGLRLPDIPVRWDDRVVRFLEFFRDDPRGRGFIRAWMRRLPRYRAPIQRTLARRGLPRDVLFVAMVESGFDTGAQSGAGAAGMWQFVRTTGEAYDLPVDHWVDMRLDPEASTDAAARYLGELHERFGTWELAFAAYNMGYGALLRTIRKYNTNDYWRLSHLEAALPFETSIYVAKIIACAIVAQNLERFGLGDLVSEAPLEWETVEVPGGTPIALAARAAETDAATLRALNPALRRNRVPPTAERWTLRIPRGASARFAQRWPRLRPEHAAHVQRTLRFGETLADVARELGVSESSLRELNEISELERVGAGSVVMVPTARPAARRPSEPAVVTVPDGPQQIPGRRRVFYRVIERDRVAEIAAFFRVPADELCRWNGVDPSALLQPGMFLQIFVEPSLDLSRALVLAPDEARVLVMGTDEFFAYHESQNGRVRFRYRIEPGDTLTRIGQRFGLPAVSLSRINQLGRDAVLRPGDELIVYAEPSRVPPELRPNAIDGDALAPGGEATTERTGPALDGVAQGDETEEEIAVPTRREPTPAPAEP